MGVVQMGKHSCGMSNLDPARYGEGAVYECNAHGCGALWKTKLYGNPNYNCWVRLGFVRSWFFRRNR